MSVSAVEVRNFVLSLTPGEKLALARELLDGISDDESQWQIDGEFAAELERRKQEMLRGEQIVPDWRASMEQVRQALLNGEEV